MTIFTHGNDKGFILGGALVILFCVSLLLLSVIEFEYSNLLKTKKEYIHIVENYQHEENLHENN